MKKSELEAEVRRLQELADKNHRAFITAVQIGVRTQRNLTKSVVLLKSLTGANDHRTWSTIQEFLEKFEIIQHPMYGEIATIPNETVFFGQCDSV